MKRMTMGSVPSLAMLLASMLTFMVAIDGVRGQDESGDAPDVTQLMQQGQMALGEQNWAEAAKAFRKATQAESENGMAWHLLGYALHSDGQLDAAIKVHRKAATFDSVKGISLYNLGCAFSLKDDPKQAIRALHQSLDAGFDQFDNFASDADLANVRKAKGYRAIANRLKNGGKRPALKPKAMPGKWKITKGTRAGEKVDPSRLPEIVITDKTITIPAGEEKFVMAYKLDSEKNPAQIDMEITAGPAPEGSRALGLIRRLGKRMTLVYDPTGEKRPTAFESTEENGCFLFVMEPVKSAEDKDDDGGDDDDGNGDDDGR